MKRFLIAGNWKMNMDLNESEDLIQSMIKKSNYNESNIDCLICPPFTSLFLASQLLENTNIKLGAQNVSTEDKGAFTGEISCSMLKSVACNYAIIGHSERRTMFFETNMTVNTKLHKLLNSSIIPILCIGETLEERQQGRTFEVLKTQLTESLKDVTNEQIGAIVIAYEPVWAIGTGVAAKIEQVDEAHNKIKEIIINRIGGKAENTLLLYGGSVNEGNSTDIFKLDNVNGALIGGASLVAETFFKIYSNAVKLS